VLFIDEIHRLPKQIEEVLYSAMEDYRVDIMIGKDSTATNISLDIAPFTLIGATTRFGDIASPLRDRFGIVFQLNYYTKDELMQIVKRTAAVYSYDINDEAAYELAKRSRGTPRVANQLLRRVRDFAQFYNLDCKINFDITKSSLEKLGIDENGLNGSDIKYIRALIEKFKGGPVGINALAAVISEEINTIEDVYEPYLLQEGFILRTSRGRIATEKAKKYIGILDEIRLF
jgi:Holliday junction DNA helicase RuvB